jgi:hypothetical protein
MYTTFINTLISVLGFQPSTRSLTHSFVQFDQTARSEDKPRSSSRKFSSETVSPRREDTSCSGGLFLVGLRSPGDQLQVVALPRK